MNPAVLCALAVTGLAGAVQAGGPFPGPAPVGPDITLCQVYGLAQFGRAGSFPTGTLGLSLATTSWNIGSAQAMWNESPSTTHPFIALNIFRQKRETVAGSPVQFTRFEHIALNWPKHGFFALSNTQCGAHPFTGNNCQGTNGTRLGVGCTDTYSASLNASQGYLGPRYEINAWTGGWSYTGSIFQTGGGPGGGIGRRIQVREADIIPPAGQTYNLFFESYYVASDDVDVMNSAGWKPVNAFSNNFNGSNAGSVTWSFSASGATTDENMGWGIDAWTPAGAQTISQGQSLFAQELPIIEKWTAANVPGSPPESPDGRALASYQVTDLGNGQWQYEYLIYNIDMDRQIGSFSIPVPEGVNVTGIGFSAPLHHNESRNGQPAGSAGVKNIDNSPWVGTRNSADVTWSTVPFASVNPSNPLRWGTAHNFWYTADQPPTTDRAIVGLFKPGTPDSLQVEVNLPQNPPPPPFCQGDADGDFDRDFTDISVILANWNASYIPGSAGLGDSDNDGDVDFADLTNTLTFFGQPCN